MYKEFSKIYDYFMENCEYDFWINQIYEILDKYKKNEGTLIDIGCGTGEMLCRFSQKYESVGLDLSVEMLTIAKKKMKNLPSPCLLFHGDMVDFNCGKKFDIAVSLFDTVNHLSSNEDLEQHLKTVKSNLNREGIYIFDIIDREFMTLMFPNRLFLDNRKKITVIWEHEIENGIDFIDATYFLKNKMGTYDKMTEVYEKKIFTDEEIKNAIKKSGLVFKELVINEKIAGKRQFYVVKNEE
jgi:cyclopropane fatty-acyl-phospholipid synthase-like methyltransferase